MITKSGLLLLKEPAMDSTGRLSAFDKDRESRLNYLRFQDRFMGTINDACFSADKDAPFVASSRITMPAAASATAAVAARLVIILLSGRVKR